QLFERRRMRSGVPERDSDLQHRADDAGVHPRAAERGITAHPLRDVTRQEYHPRVTAGFGGAPRELMASAALLFDKEVGDEGMVGGSAPGAGVCGAGRRAI